MAFDYSTLRKGAQYKLNRGFSTPEFQRLKFAGQSKLMGSIAPGANFELTQIERMPPLRFAMISKNGPPAHLVMTPAEFEYYFVKAEFNIQVVRRAASSLTQSDKGVDFLYRIEAWKGVSNKLHWPNGESGVTLGPGYDMKLRSKDAIKADMILLGLAEPVAKGIAEAAGKSGPDAQKFAQDNKTLVDLSETQEKSLMKIIIPHYEKLASKYITVPLAQYEYDALVSFCYNPSTSIVSVMTAINQGKISDAMADIKRRVPKDGPNRQGLINRRTKEIDLFMNAKY